VIERAMIAAQRAAIIAERRLSRAFESPRAKKKSESQKIFSVAPRESFHRDLDARLRKGRGTCFRVDHGKHKNMPKKNDIVSHPLHMQYYAYNNLADA
jgi:hypothetical protein